MEEWTASRVATGPPRTLAPLEVVDGAYKALLALMELEWPHRQDLLKRGLSEAVIEREGFGSWPSTQDEADEFADEVYQEFGDDVFGVPGFWCDEHGAPRLCRRGAGWVVPTKDLEGRIVSLRVRLDKPFGDSKYLWASSSNRNGPSAIVTARLAMPETVETPDVCLVTEGEIKSMVAASHLGIPAISVPGVSNYDTSIVLVKHLNPRLVAIAFDADYLGKAGVQSAYIGLADSLESQGFEVTKAVWNGV
jgi:DNA primase